MSGHGALLFIFVVVYDRFSYERLFAFLMIDRIIET